MSGCLNRRYITYFLTALAKFVCRIMIAEYLQSNKHRVLSLETLAHLRENADQGKQDPQSSFIRNHFSTRESANNHDEASLEMPDNGTLEWS